MLRFIEFILSVVIFIVIFAIPLIGIVFTETSHKRWLGHWMITLFAINFMLPVLNFLLPTWFVNSSSSSWECSGC